MTISFPQSFTWGVSTSAYQIEGGRTDGKGDSIWDVFAHQPGRMPHTGDVACDHYHRYPQDVALMADLGLDAYHFSLAWSRVLPDGRGEVNSAGVGFYDRLVDELLAHDIEPWITLYHWDLPQALQDEGGWPQRGIVDAFLRYTEVVTRALGDRVSVWITHNEPWVSSMVGHRDGEFAPGMRSWDAALATAHHLLLSHGRAVPVIREHVPDARVGITLDCRPSSPASDDPADVAAQRHFDGFRNRWFFDPVFGRGYPQDMIDAYRARGHLPDGPLPFAQPHDAETIAAPIDFLGLNYYTTLEIAAGQEESEDTGVEPGPNPPAGHTEMGWPVVPEGLTDYLVHVRDEYAPTDIVVTENGASYGDVPDDTGHVDDQRRIDYLDQHIRAIREAMDRGVPVSGYFVWSLLDNLEWTSGYDQRFGLVWVDHETQERIPKASFHWYADVIANDGIG